MDVDKLLTLQCTMALSRFPSNVVVEDLDCQL